MANAPKKIRVVLADDHPVVREGLKTLVNDNPHMEVVGEACDGASACEVVKELQPDVLVVDISMPRMNGVQTTQWVKRECPKTKVLALTLHDEKSYLQQLLEAGASGYVLKRSPADELLRAIRSVSMGGTHLDPAIAGRVVGVFSARNRTSKSDRGTKLSERENEVLRLIALGFTNKEMGAQLDLSVKTVETYKARILAKLHLSSRADIVRYAIEQGWMDHDQQT